MRFTIDSTCNVILIVAPQCPKCQEAKHQLDKHSIPFTEMDPASISIVSDAESLWVLAGLRRRFIKTAPVLVFWPRGMKEEDAFWMIEPSWHEHEGAPENAVFVEGTILI